MRERRRPAKTATSASKTRAVFGDKARKQLPIPKAIDLYNHHMNGVDQTDQGSSLVRLVGDDVTSYQSSRCLSCTKPINGNS